MTAVDIFLNQLERRLNIHVVQQILRESDLLSARSWGALKSIVKSAIAKDEAIVDRLREALIMQQLCDMKAVAFYELNKAVSARLHAELLSCNVPKSDLAEAFPIDADESKLKADNGALKIVYKFADDFGVGVVLSRRRSFTENVDVHSNQFTPELKRQFPDADKIIAVKVYARQTYDVLYLNIEHGILEVRADVTREHGQLQTTGQQTQSVGDLRAFATAYLSTIVHGFSLGAPINLLPLAKKVYEDLSGAIKKIGFSTEEESVKRETMKAGVDLRSELFHKSGAAAISHKMAIFEVAIQWHGAGGVGGVPSGKPEIHIPGSHREYVKAGARTDCLLVKGVRTFADANFILNKLKSYK